MATSISAARAHEELLSTMARSEQEFREACRSARETAETGNDALFARAQKLGRAYHAAAEALKQAQYAVAAACKLADSRDL